MDGYQERYFSGTSTRDFDLRGHNFTSPYVETEATARPVTRRDRRHRSAYDTKGQPRSWHDSHSVAVENGGFPVRPQVHASRLKYRLTLVFKPSSLQNGKNDSRLINCNTSGRKPRVRATILEHCCSCGNTKVATHELEH